MQQALDYEAQCKRAGGLSAPTRRALAQIAEGKAIPDLRCKCEVGARQQRELTFTLPKNSVSFCTAARRLGAHFAECCAMNQWPLLASPLAGNFTKRA